MDVGAMPPWGAEFLKGCLNARLNILVAGGVGAGKTTMLRVMGCEIPREDRLAIIEDTRELFLEEIREGPDTFSLFARAPNAEGKGEITLAMLLRNSLRMSPDRVFVGEVRGQEALYLVQAMSSGFYGSAGTIHAETAEDTLPQLLRYVMQHPEAGSNPEVHMQAICEAIHLIVYIKRVRMADGTVRKLVDHVAAVAGYNNENKTARIERLFEFDEHLEEGWKWVGPKLNDIGGDKWQARWVAANLDINKLVSPDIIAIAHLNALGATR
jgi:pilus assembly protein CpaF